MSTLDRWPRARGRLFPAASATAACSTRSRLSGTRRAVPLVIEPPHPERLRVPTRQDQPRHRAERAQQKQAAADRAKRVHAVEIIQAKAQHGLFPKANRPQRVVVWSIIQDTKWLRQRIAPTTVIVILSLGITTQCVMTMVFAGI